MDRVPLPDASQRAASRNAAQAFGIAIKDGVQTVRIEIGATIGRSVAPVSKELSPRLFDGFALGGGVGFLVAVKALADLIGKARTENKIQ
jgi:hypothetical protein